MPCAQWEIGSHMSGQSCPRSVAAVTDLGIGWLVRLPVWIRRLSRPSRPLHPAAPAVPLLLAEIVQCTAGGDHFGSEGIVQVTPFLQHPPPGLQCPKGLLYTNAQGAEVHVEGLLFWSHARGLHPAFQHPGQKRVGRVSHNHHPDVHSLDVPYAL